MKSDSSRPLADIEPVAGLTPPVASSQENGLTSHYRPILAKVHDLATLGRELVIRGFSQRTIREYLGINQRFLTWLNKSAKSATGQDIKNYLLFLKARGLTNTSVNLTISALKFYFEQILKRKLFFSIKRPKREKYLPTVLAKEEIVKLIEATNNLKHKLLMSLMYGSGLRVSEAVSLKIQHVDLVGSRIMIKAGKGVKDRQSLLSGHSRELFKQYLATLPKEQDFLFAGAGNLGHLTSRSAQKIFVAGLAKAGIKKTAGIHCLRHSFATHLLQNKTDITIIQKLLGHQSIKTTQGYARVADGFLGRVSSPLD